MAAIAPIGSIGALTNIANAAAVGGTGSVSGGIASVSGGIDPTLGGAGTIGTGSPTGATPTSDPSTSGQSFIDTLGNALGQLNTQLSAADASMADFAAGGSSDLHTVMLQMQEASIGVKVATQFRDRLLEAYQEIMRLQL